MTDDLDKIAQELQQTVLEGYSPGLKQEVLHPNNIGMLQNADYQKRITGSCGDSVEMFVSIKADRINDMRFLTDGCGVAIACASYVTRTAKGKTVEGALRISEDKVDSYFEGLPEETRHCAKLAVEALKAVLQPFVNRKKENRNARSHDV